MHKQEEIALRTIKIGEECARTGKTVRQLALGKTYSKSTVHKDLTERLPKLDRKLFKKVRKVLDKNKNERHLRGGEATKRRYARMY